MLKKLYNQPYNLRMLWMSQVWLKLAQWFLRNRYKIEIKVCISDNNNTDRKHTNFDYKS